MMSSCIAIVAREATCAPELVFLLCSLQGDVLHGEEFKVSLDRTQRAGDIYEVSYRLTQVFTIVAQGNVPAFAVDLKKPTELRTTVTLAGELRIVDVDKRGRALESAVTVKKWSYKDNYDGDFSFDPTGKVLRVLRKDRKRSFYVQRKELDGLEEDIVYSLLAADGMGEVGSDARFGTKSRRRIGDSWLMQADNAYLDDVFHDTSICLDKSAKREKGTVRLAGRVRYNGVDCLQIEVEQLCKNGIVADSDTQVEVTRSTVQRHVSAILPINTRTECLRCTDTRQWVLITKVIKGELRGIHIRYSFAKTAHKTAKLKARGADTKK